MIITDYLKALGQIGDSRFLRVLALGLGLTIALLFGFTVAFAWTVGLIIPDSFTLPWIGEITWVDNLASLAVIPVMLIASIFLMVPVASAFTGIFLDDVVDAVEAKHYPGLPPVAHVPFAESITETLKFLGLLLAVNLAALILCLIFAPFAPLIFWGVNGLMLGREYATLVARRRHHDLAGRHLHGHPADHPGDEPDRADHRRRRLHPPHTPPQSLTPPLHLVTNILEGCPCGGRQSLPRAKS